MLTLLFFIPLSSTSTLPRKMRKMLLFVLSEILGSLSEILGK